MGFACLAWLHNHVHPHKTGDPVRLIPCMGVLEADEGKFLFKLFRYSSANNFF